MVYSKEKKINYLLGFGSNTINSVSAGDKCYTSSGAYGTYSHSFYQKITYTTNANYTKPGLILFYSEKSLGTGTVDIDNNINSSIIRVLWSIHSNPEYWIVGNTTICVISLYHYNKSGQGGNVKPTTVENLPRTCYFYYFSASQEDINTIENMVNDSSSDYAYTKFKMRLHYINSLTFSDTNAANYSTVTASEVHSGIGFNYAD